jgi:hypothetical protein
MRNGPSECRDSGMKRCAGQCAEIKPLEAFFVSIWFPHGRTPRCKQCVFASAKHSSETDLRVSKRRSDRGARKSAAAADSAEARQ